MKTARDIMTTKVIALDPDMSLDEMDSALRAARISGAPVERDGKLLGIISRSDVARQLSVEGAYLESAMQAFTASDATADDPTSISEQLGRRLQQLTVEDAMIREVDTVTQSESLQSVASKMLASQHRRLIVLDDGGKIAGIVTATDLVRVIAEKG